MESSDAVGIKANEQKLSSGSAAGSGKECVMKSVRKDAAGERREVQESKPFVLLFGSLLYIGLCSSLYKFILALHLCRYRTPPKKECPGSDTRFMVGRDDDLVKIEFI